jgi:serine/threonine protein phosphatase PrpC
VRVTAAVQTDRGQVRGENQDSYGFSSALGLYVVADGMGGRAAGKRASEEATAAVTETIRASTTDAQLTGDDRLREGIGLANRRLWELSQSDPHLYGMGTTIAALLLDGDVAHIAHVGDSRVYRIRDGTIRALTRDHSVAAELEDRGIELQGAAPRGQLGLTRAVGVAPTVEVALTSERVQPDDFFVLCSDGIYRMVTTAEMQEIVLDARDDPARACAAIVARANAAGGSDNSTIIVIRALPTTAPESGTPGAS